MNLKRYRASVLQDACTGKLVPTEAELARTKIYDYEPADLLLQRIIAERRTRWEADQLARLQAQGKQPKDEKWKLKYEEPTATNFNDLPNLPEGWKWTSVESLGVVQLGRQRSPKNRSDKNPTQYIRAANITETGLKLDDLLDMEFTPDELERYRLIYGDILLSEASGSPDQVGKPAMWKDEVKDCAFQNTVLRLRPSIDINSYCLVVFKSYYFNKRFVKVAGGVGINHLSAEKFSKLEFPLPPLAEQERIVAEVERCLSIAEHMDIILTSNLKRAERLKQSILRDAFAGRLVPQDPTDEPASTLLQRIQAEKLAARTVTVMPQMYTARQVTELELLMAQGKTRPLQDVLKESNQSMLVEDLFKRAGFTPDRVDDFYRELLSIRERIVEEKNGKTVRIGIDTDASG